MVKARRHHNTTGRRQIVRGKTRTQVKHMAQRLGVRVAYGKTPIETPIETRYATLGNGQQYLDEIVATNALIHLEKMDNHWFSLIVETATELVCYGIQAEGTKGHATIAAVEQWREPKPLPK